MSLVVVCVLFFSVWEGCDDFSRRFCNKKSSLHHCTTVA